MTTKDIAKKYGIDQNKFENFLINTDKPFHCGLLFITVDDENVESFVEDYLLPPEEQERRRKAADEEQKKRLEAQRLEEQKKHNAMKEILISSCPGFDGYKVVKYAGYISGDSAIELLRSGFNGGNNGGNMLRALERIRDEALNELREKAYNMECNAIVGIDYDYITLEPETANISGGTLYEPYIICLTVNGTAVVIEKHE